MDTSMNGDYRSGTVQIYDDKAGYGYISPDEPQDKSDRLLVHRRSLRNPDTLLQQGDRVIYKAEHVPRGTLAADVHLELVPLSQAPSDSADTSGRVSKNWSRVVAMVSLRESWESGSSSTSLNCPTLTLHPR